MNVLGPLAALLGIEVESITERVRNAVILNAVMIVLSLTGLGFLVAAGYIAVATSLGGLYAALIFGGVSLLLALAVFLGMRMGEGRRHREVVERRRSSETSAFVTTAALTALPVLLRSPVVRSLGLPAAAVAAFLLVRNADKRDD